MAAKPLRDAGLQPERTALAWIRTGLALCANALLALRAGVIAQRTDEWVLGVVLLLLGAVVMAFGAARNARLAQGDVLAVPPAAMLGVVGGALLACLCGLMSLGLSR
ncbi:MAG: DUF202 domain-containing protein [Burkholderiales bacterium]|nr:DUF202 domain-containing protein [Burkholderiales bacterium]